jgi:predicted heme/steroid binding protein
MSKRIRIFTASDILRHESESSCWITYKGKVLDVTTFLADHPGGEEFILKYAGRDVEDAMKDAEEHVHSESAYDLLNEFVIGRLGAGESVVSDDWVATDDFTPDDTDETADFEKNQFLDLRKPLMRQMWDCNFRCVFSHEVGRGHVLTTASSAKRIIFSKSISPGTSPSLRFSSKSRCLRLARTLRGTEDLLRYLLVTHEDEVVGGTCDLAAHSGIHWPARSSSVRWHSPGIVQNRPISPSWPRLLPPG